MPDAVARAKEYLTAALRQAPGLGHGHGPVHHFWALWKDEPLAAAEASIWARATGQAKPAPAPAAPRATDLRYEELLRTVGQMLDDSGDDLAVLDLWSHGVVIQSVGRSGAHEIQLSEIEVESAGAPSGAARATSTIHRRARRASSGCCG